MIILIDNDNYSIVTEKETIMQRDKLTNKLYIRCPQTYKDLDMKDFDLIMTYKLPISKTRKPVTLSRSDALYADTYYEYTLDIDTDITSENGDVELQFIFLRTYLDPDGNNIQQVRNVKPTSIHICQLDDWLVPSDEALSTLAELYLTNKNMIKSLEQLATTLYQTKLDDITIDIENKKVIGTANGNTVGGGISLEELNNELVEVGADTTGNVKIQNI